MVYRKIDPGIKTRALQMLKEGYRIDQIAGVLAVHPDSIPRWQANFEQHGNVAPPIITTGRPRVLTPPLLRELSDLVRDEPDIYLDELVDWLALAHDQPISMGCLCNNLLGPCSLRC